MYLKIIFYFFSLLILVNCANVSPKVNQESAAIQQQRAQKAFEELDKETSPKQEVTPESKVTEKKFEPVMKDDVTEKVSGDKVQEKKLEDYGGYPFRDGRPIWFYDPFYDGYLGALGIGRKDAARGGYAGQKRLAKTLAQAELAKQIRVFVSTELNTTGTSSSVTSKDKVYENYKSTLSTLSVHRAEEIVRDAVIKDEWTDPKNGDLYIWLVMEKQERK